MTATAGGFGVISTPLYLLYELQKGKLKLGRDRGGLVAPSHGAVLPHVCPLLTEGLGVAREEISHHLYTPEDDRGTFHLGSSCPHTTRNNGNDNRETGRYVFERGSPCFYSE